SVVRPWRPSAPVRPTRRPSCGCGACGTKLTSSTSPNTPRIALTSGEPAGIGPEICLALATRPLPCSPVCLGDRKLLGDRARQLRSPVILEAYGPGAARAPHRPGTLAVAHEALAAASLPGSLDVRNAPYVLKLLDLAIDGALTGEFDALVTAPVQKSL